MGSDRPHIAIDARMINTGSMHGIARYVYQLLDCLRGKEPPPFRFSVLINRGSPLMAEEWPSFVELVPINARWISFQEQWELPRELARIGADLFHAPSFVAPLMCPCRLVMTIHDLNHIVLPQFYTPFHQFYYQTFVRRCIQRSRYILTVSRFSKHEIVQNLQVRPDKVFVTYNGVSSTYSPVADDEQLRYVRDVYELPEEFIFCLSNNKPHKNIHTLVRAYCFSNLQVPLVLASAVNRQLIRIAENYGKKHLLYFTRFIDERHLPAVYSMTRLFVYPSTYEGFGLPPLEALACGARVVVARSSSLPEVVGNNAAFVDPYDFQDVAQTLELAVEGADAPPSRQERMTYAREFSWEKMAAETLRVYDRCLQP